MLFDRSLYFFGVMLGVIAVLGGCSEPQLTPYDMKRAREFMLSSLPPVPEDPSNRYANDPAAAAFGEQLFFDAGLSADSNIACASCHVPRRAFQDNLQVAFGVENLKRRTMPLAGSQWGQWFFWDGRKDSLWSQALEPFEAAAEHGMTRDMVGREVLTRYPETYERVFGKAPDHTQWPYRVSPLVEGAPKAGWQMVPIQMQNEINTVFANIGKALAAFQRTLKPEENRIDRFFEARFRGEDLPEGQGLNADEIEGFKLFTGKAQCDNCHSGPLYTDHFFHNTGVPFANTEDPDFGRAAILSNIRNDPFSCLGSYSDAQQHECGELEFMSDDPATFEGAFKTPGLRGVSKRSHFMHAGQLATLEDVIEHYLARPDPFQGISKFHPDGKEHEGHTAVPQIKLDETEKAQLLAFLKAL